MLSNRVSILLSRVSPRQEDLTQMQDTRIARILSAAYSCYDKCNEVILSARRDIPGSRRLSDQADMIIELVRSAERAPHTNFMPDIAVNVMKAMEDMFVHVRYEASHPIFQWMRNMDTEASALEGRMHALKVLLEAEIEWKKNNSDSRRSEHNEHGAGAT